MCLRRARALWLCAWVLTASAAPAGSDSLSPVSARRIVALGGDVTEIVYALGEGQRLVCDDETALYPAAATELPRVGYLRTLSAEGVLACRPDLILASQDAGPAVAVAQLKASGVPVVAVTSQHSLEAVASKITVVAQALGIPECGATLLARFEASLTATRAALAAYRVHPRALFVMTQGAGGVMAAGRDTAADAMLRLAGADNVAASFSGYKPLTPESAVALRPEVIVIAESAVNALGGRQALRSRPEFALTPAAENDRIVPMDALLLLGFGPRTPEALAQLASALHSSGRRVR